MTDIAIALLEENKRLQERIDELQFDLAKESVSLNKATLYAKKALVMSKINRVKESGKHQQGWKYATSEDVKEVVRKAMAEAGLSLSFELMDYEMDRGDKRMVITGRIAFTLECSETGATDTKIIFAEAIDYVKGGGAMADKTFFKLYTTAEKYFLKTTFLMASGEELDSDNDAPPDKKVPTVSKQTKKQSLEQFLELACKEFELERQDILDELKSAGFTGYNPKKSTEMWEALEKARRIASQSSASQEIANKTTTNGPTDLEDLYPDILGDEADQPPLENLSLDAESDNYYSE